MATKGSIYPKKREVAKLVTENRQPCVFCNEDVDDEVIYGKLYALGDIQCHYFCVLLSCCLVQKGRDSEGLFGFLYKDIQAEVERSKKHKCSYCGRGGASLGCSVVACRKQFHLPCGRRKHAVSLFYGNYKSFCELHAPKQKISEPVMAKAKERMKRDKLIRAGKIPVTVSNVEDSTQTDSPGDPALLCVICYEDVQAYPSTQTFWPPCCGRDAWLHRTCLQRMALTAGMHYLKCPLCNDKDNFYDAVCGQGYYLPDRDAAWELEQNAFAEIYSRDAECAAAECKCPFGRGHDELGKWDIKLCLLCGSWGMHAFCSGGERTVCASCRPAATDIEQLEARLTAVIMAEQAREQRRARSGPLMPSRMSLRRTKGRLQHSASSTSQMPALDSTENKTEPVSPALARLDLNLKPPRRPAPSPSEPQLAPPPLLSPLKLFEQTYVERGGRGGDALVSEELLSKIRLRFSKPRPLCAKKKIVNEILDDIFQNVVKENSKSKEPLKEWNSPRKSCDITNDLNEEEKDNLEPILSRNIETELSENVANSDHADIEITDLNSSEESKLEDENCEIDHQDIKPILEKESKLDESSKTHLNDNDDENGNVRDTVMSENDNNDESSRSTFQLPSEFIAESEDSLPILDTPKKLKMVDMKQDSSIEISEKNETLNIDVVQIGSGKEMEFIKNLTLETPVKNRMCSFKFSPLAKEPLQEDVDMDVESFKDQYLNEVGRDKSSCDHLTSDVLHSVDVNIESGIKRKLDMQDGVVKKRRTVRKSKKQRLKIKIKMNDKKKRVKKIKRIKELQLKGRMPGVKIQLKEKIKKNKKMKIKTYKQYVLKYSPLLTQTSKVIEKPEVEVTPMKRKYTKLDKFADNLVQTSIQSFFKAK